MTFGHGTFVLGTLVVETEFGGGSRGLVGGARGSVCGIGALWQLIALSKRVFQPPRSCRPYCCRPRCSGTFGAAPARLVCRQQASASWRNKRAPRKSGS